MMEKHIADGETTFYVINVPPDFCEVDDDVVPFDIIQTLHPEQADYAKTVFARDEKVLMVNSIVKEVVGDTGSGVGSEVSLGDGHSKIQPNNVTVYVEDRQAARHLDKVWMNCRLGG